MKKSHIEMLAELLVILSIVIEQGVFQDISSIVDVKTLSELPLEKLLHVQGSFKEPEVVHQNSKSEMVNTPEALALQSKHKSNDRGGYQGYHSYEEEHSKKSGKKSVQSIFQLSVTTLAFLAFGGYLLCLLVQAIKGKNMMDPTPLPTMAAFIRPVPIKRRTTRRPTRLQRPTRRPYAKRPSPRVRRDIWPEADPENMYHALVHLSEAYANYHTIDYKRFNYTSRYYN